jgi:hypothetical protein
MERYLLSKTRAIFVQHMNQLLENLPRNPQPANPASSESIPTAQFGDIRR